MSEYEADERYSVPGFAYPDGRPAELFSSDCAATVLRHFRWMQAHKIDGVWQQRFLVGLPGGPYSHSYSSHERVVRHVASACEQTGRVWAISYDLAALPVEKIFDVLTNDWKRLVDQKIVNHDRYVHQDGLPVIQIWGFYYQNAHNAMTPELANRLIDFFHSPGPYRAYLVGGGSWDWRQVPDPQWQAFVLRFDAYAPWNVGNYSLDASQQAHAATHYWAEDKRVCEEHGVLWMPVVYPGFSWDNLQRCPPGSTIIPRRGGLFLWEQFCELAQMKVDTVYVAMFDEVDEGTAIFKVTSSPPTQAHFVGYEGLASDWYLRLVAEGVRMTRGERPVRRELPIN